MPSETKATTSRRNGAQSRGPRTPAGKARSSANALRHGLTAETFVVIPGENAGELEALADRMRATLAPEGELEERLVERVVGLVWRLRRAGRVEAAVFTYLDQHEGRRARGWSGWDALTGDAPMGFAFRAGSDTVLAVSRYEAGLDRALYAALHELQRLQAARAGEPVRAPAALDVTVTAGDEAA